MTCIVCHSSEPADGWTCCRPCLDSLDADLEHIAQCAQDAAALGVAPTRGGGMASEEIKLPISADAVDVALGLCLVRVGTDSTPLLDLLETWIRLVREEANLSPYGVATEGQNVTVASSVAFLRSWLLWAVERPHFPLDDLAIEVRICRNTVAKYHHDHGAADDLTRLGCPSPHPDGDGRRCHNRIKYDRERPTQDMHCIRCGETWTPARLLAQALGDDTQQVWAYPADIEAVIGINKRTLQRWAATGIVPRDGNRYDVGAAFRTRSRQSA